MVMVGVEHDYATSAGQRGTDRIVRMVHFIGSELLRRGFLSCSSERRAS